MANERRSENHGSPAAGAPRTHDATSSPGKRTLVESAHGQVQHRTGGAIGDGAEVHQAAARGATTPSQALPHAGRIQQLFGRHDVSSIQAHVGGEAAATAGAMGARAYATGNHVVLGEATDLHTV